MRPLFRIAAILLILVGLPAQLAAADARPGGDRRPIIGVVTQNQYFGADLFPLVAADPAQFNAAFLEVLEQVVATDFRARARQQAKAIARRRPDLVGLQEVLALGCIDALPTPPLEGGCNHPLIKAASVDFLKVTLRELRRLGARYEAAAVVENFDTRGLVVTRSDAPPVTLPGLPLTIDDVQVFITAVDRDVILAHQRSVQRVEPVEFPCPDRSSVDGCNYDFVLEVPLTVAGGTVVVAFERGFVGVDAKVRGHRYRMVNTHLEVRQPAPDNPASRFFQAAQAAQLIAVLEATTPASRHLIVSGDINSAPEDEPLPGPPPIVPPYEQFVQAGLIDVWTLRPRRDPGFTCCQETNLLNELSLLNERIDIVFTGEPPRRASVDVFNDRRNDKTPSGLWPSDHAGVSARLLFQPEGAMVTAGR